jgi:hypothetical protein
MACNSEMTNQLEPKGAALGKMNEIVVVADQDMWEGSVGDTFKYYFQSAYPILPNPEPVFDLRHFTVNELNSQPLRKELRTYAILADMSDEESATTKMVMKDMGSEKSRAAKLGEGPTSSVGKNKWARGQLLFYLFGSDKETLSTSIKNHFSAVARRVNQHDEKQLESSIYIDRTNQGFTQKLKDQYGLDMTIPGEYKLVIESESSKTIWLRYDSRDAIQNIVVKSIPYTNQDQLSKSNIIKIRNDFGSKYITSDEKDDVMVVNEKDLPVYEYTFDLDGKYTKEIRGVWEMSKAFAGGPFTTYMIVDEDNKRLIYIDTFVLAPGTRKRNLMMQLDYIVKSGRSANRVQI